MYKEIIEKILFSIVDKTEEVKITEIGGKSVDIYELRVAKSDFGKVLGKSGKNIQSIRTLLNAVAAKNGKRVYIEVVE